MALYFSFPDLVFIIRSSLNLIYGQFLKVLIYFRINVRSLHVQQSHLHVAMMFMGAWVAQIGDFLSGDFLTGIPILYLISFLYNILNTCYYLKQATS